MRRFPQDIWTLVFSLAMVGFAICTHRANPTWWPWVCLAVAGCTLTGSLVLAADPIRVVLGHARSTHRSFWIVAAVGLAVVAAATCRIMAGRPIFVEQLTSFAWVAMVIGLAEEFVWRGWILGSLTERCSFFGANIGAAASHTAYKTALFLLPPAGYLIGSGSALLTLAALTFGAGLLIGFFRTLEGTIVPAAVSHVVFDILVYGDLTSAPWWVY